MGEQLAGVHCTGDVPDRLDPSTILERGFVSRVRLYTSVVATGCSSMYGKDAKRSEDA